MKKNVSIKTINKNKTSKTLLNVFMLTFIMFVVLIGNVYALSYTVSYNNNTGSGTMSDSTYTSNPGTLRTNTFTKSGYKFMGWNKNSGATSDWYRDTNSFTGTDGSSTTLYAQWCKNSQGTIKISNNEVKDTYGNYVFRNNKYITVKADNKTITYGSTPSYSYTVTGALNGESGVTGTASYTVKDGSNNIITTSPIPVGSYTVSVSGLSAATGYSIQNTNTGTLTVNAAQCSTPTNVAVSTGGYVTWTASSNCSSAQHQVSIDGTNWTDATSGHNYLSTIIAQTGTRTVRVRAVAPNANYTTSNAASKAVTVYTITFASNDTNKGTVSPTSYKVISGATVTTSSNNLLIKGVTTGSTTTTLQTITPTAKTGYHFGSWSKTSGSLTSAQTITATFVGNTYTIHFDANGGNEFLETQDIRYSDRKNWTLESNIYKSYANLDAGYSSVLYSREITLTSTQTLSFQWAVSCESYYTAQETYTYNGETYTYDASHGARLYYTITKDGSTMSGTGTSTAITGNSNVSSESGLTYATVTKSLEAGTYKITFTYHNHTHESNGAQGLNRGFVKDLSITNTDLGMPDESMTVGQSKALTKNTYFRNGYHFLGWNTNSNATTATYTDEQSISNLTTTQNAIITLYAIWEIDTYTVTVNVTNGTPATQSFTVTAGSVSSSNPLYVFTTPTSGYGSPSLSCTPYLYMHPTTLNKDRWNFTDAIVGDVVCTVTYSSVGTYTAKLSLVNGTISGSATKTVSVGYSPVYTIIPTSGYGAYNSDKSIIVAQESLGSNGTYQTTLGGTTYVSPDGLKLIPLMGTWSTYENSTEIKLCTSGKTCQITITLNKTTNYTYTTTTDSYMTNTQNYCCSTSYSWSTTNGVFTIASGTWIPGTSTAGGVHKNALNKYCLDPYLTESSINAGTTLGSSCSGWSSSMKRMTSCSAYSTTDSNYCVTRAVTEYSSDIYTNSFYKCSSMEATYSSFLPWDF